MKQLYLRTMTVANIRHEEGADFIEVVFLESARFYRLLKGNSAYGGILQKLEQALANAGQVKVGFKSIESEVIEDVE